MCKLKKILNQTMLINLYYSLIYSHIVYCIQAWGNAGVTDLNHILILQKRSVKLLADNQIMSNTPGVLQSSDPLFFKLNILKIKEIYFKSLNLFLTVLIIILLRTFKTDLN